MKLLSTAILAMSFFFSSHDIHANQPFEVTLRSADLYTPIFDENKTRYTLVQDNVGSENWLFVPGGAGADSVYLETLVQTMDLPGKVWLIDLPGNGSNNPKKSNEKLFSQWKHYLDTVVDKFERPIYVGHSFGGMIAMDMPALEQKLKAFIVVGSAPFIEIGEILKIINERNITIDIQQLFSYFKNPEKIIEKKSRVYPIECHFPKQSKEMGLRLFKNLTFNHKAAVWWIKQLPFYKASWVSENVPMLIIGGREDCICPVSLFQKDTRFQKDNIFFHIIDNAGHFPWLDDPNQVSELIKTFAKEQCSIKVADKKPIVTKLKETLKTCYEVDNYASCQIMKHFSKLMDNSENYPIIEDFIKASKSLKKVNTNQSKNVKLYKDDAVLKALNNHTVLFENLHFRILHAHIAPGETANYHSHQWDRFLITLNQSTLEHYDEKGNSAILDCYPEVETMEGSLEIDSFKNIGNTPFEGLVFEIKS